MLLDDPSAYAGTQCAYKGTKNGGKSCGGFWTHRNSPPKSFLILHHQNKNRREDKRSKRREVAAPRRSIGKQQIVRCRKKKEPSISPDISQEIRALLKSGA